MITVKTQLVNENSNDFIKSIGYSVLNESIKAVSEELKNELKNIECPIHKDKTKGIITVKSDPFKKKIKVDKSSFCCKEFSESISIG